MKRLSLCFLASSLLQACTLNAENDVHMVRNTTTEEVTNTYSMQTVTYKQRQGHALDMDIYLPTKQQSEPYPVLIWIHGGAWFRGSKERTIPQNGNLVSKLTEEGYAVVALNYSLSGQAQFPAPIQDINDAINFLYDNGEQFNIEASRVGMMGRSAGGHLAALISASNNDKDTKFYDKGNAPKYKVAVVVDFFGVSNLEALTGNSGKVDHDAPDAAEAKLLGDSPRNRPDLARWASPTTYIDNDSPPFILFHGDNDQIVPASQSELLKAELDRHGVTNELFIQEGATHGDPIFDTDQYVDEVVAFIKQYMH